MSGKMLLLSGEGQIPLLIYQRAVRTGEVLVLSSPFLRPESALPVHFWCSPLSVGTIVRLARAHGIQKVCLAGKVPKNLLFQEGFLSPDAEHIYPSFGDKNIITGVMEHLAQEGLEIVSSLVFLEEHLTPSGILVGNAPDSREWSDIALGFRVARFLADAEIGQTVVVQRGTVLALEGAEGTDETIKRGLELGRGGIVVKVARSRQDFFVDVPVIGLQTVELVGRCGGKILAVESDKTLFLDRKEALAKADMYSLSIVGIECQDG